MCLCQKCCKKLKVCEIEVESSSNLIKLLPDFHTTFLLISKKLGRVKTVYPVSRGFLSCRFYLLVFSWLSLLLIFFPGKRKKVAVDIHEKTRN